LNINIYKILILFLFQEQKTTSDKNREIAMKIRAGDRALYEKFKGYLNKTGQSTIVELLDCIKNKDDRRKEKIEEKLKQEEAGELVL